jgi:hypothetical protein
LAEEGAAALVEAGGLEKAAVVPAADGGGADAAELGDLGPGE